MLTVSGSSASPVLEAADGALEDLSVLSRAVFGLPDDADTKVTEQLKHMRKLGFPSSGRVGQGGRRT